MDIQRNTKKPIIIKRDGTKEYYNIDKIRLALRRAFKAEHIRYPGNVLNDIDQLIKSTNKEIISISDIQDIIENYLMKDYPPVAKSYILYRNNRDRIRAFVDSKKKFITKYKDSYNNADATVDDNSNVCSKNIGLLNAEIHKEDNIEVNRGMVIDKLKELYPDFDSKQYIRDLKNHIIYKHDESSMPIPAPYCVAVSLYPFLNDGIQKLGGLSAAPKNLDSFSGMFGNFIFSVASQFLGAVAVPEALLYFTYFCKKAWGEDFWKRPDEKVSNKRTIQTQIHQHFQQIVYGINQPSGSRNMQAAFVNFAYFDKEFFNSMFGDFVFPDFTKPDWESLNWIQREFMQWFNKEREKIVLTFPVETYSLVYDENTKEFKDKESADFVAQMYSEGHSFFTYMSDSIDSLSSCCRLRNALTTREFSFTNGNSGVRTGSVSVITINLNRNIQDYCKTINNAEMTFDDILSGFNDYLDKILDRIYIYHRAYKEILWDMYDANLLTVYKADFIGLNDQYNTIGINGLNQAAEFLGITCDDNLEYKKFCQSIFKHLTERNRDASKDKFNNHIYRFNTELVPAESLAVKNYNWDKEDGYWVPADTNLYASYIFKPNDNSISVLDRIKLHGKDYTGELDGGSACHNNLEEHLTKDQYRKLLDYSAKVGCNYLTFNIPMSSCDDCGKIYKKRISKCPHCGSENITLYTRIIGYLTAVKNWSNARREEFKTRIFKMS